MAYNFDPKKVLRQTSHHLLRDLFEVHHHELDVPWDDLKQTQVNEIFDAWQALPEEGRRTIEIILQEVHEMADRSGDGIRAIVEEAIRRENQELIDDIEGYDSRHDKAVWTYIKARDVWEAAVRFARADTMSRGRYWVKRIDIPCKTPGVDAATIAELEAALSAFFMASQGRGRHCKIEHYVRACGSDYFFTYLDDYADTYVNLDTSGEFARTAERRAFELVFVYHRGLGTLELFARGGKKVNEPLQEIFCRVILTENIGPENSDSHPYELNGLISGSFEFPTDPEDGIEMVQVRKLRLTVIGMPRRRITLEADPDAGPDDIYDMMDAYLNRHRLHPSIVNVTQVGFKFTFDREEEWQPKSLSFEVSHPNSSNLKSKPERLHQIGEKYLGRWRLDRAGTPEPALAAS